MFYGLCFFAACGNEEEERFRIQIKQTLAQMNEKMKYMDLNARYAYEYSKMNKETLNRIWEYHDTLAKFYETLGKNANDARSYAMENNNLLNAIMGSKGRGLGS